MQLTVPHQNRSLEPPARERIRRFKRHLVAALRDLRIARHPDRLIQPPWPEPDDNAAAVLRRGCAACRGHCCLGGGDHAYLDERTMARVRRDQPELDAPRVIAAYVRHIAPLSYVDSCLFHGPAGCTLDRSLRADLCASYYCDGLQAFLRNPVPAAQVTIQTSPPSVRSRQSCARLQPKRRQQTDG